jgi:hypothetical protein
MTMHSVAVLWLALLLAGACSWGASAAPNQTQQPAACNATTTRGVCGPTCVRETQEALRFLQGLLKADETKVCTAPARARAAPPRGGASTAQLCGCPPSCLGLLLSA